MPHSIVVIVGSLRKASLNRKMAQVLIGLAPTELSLELVDISQLTMYNQDLDDQGEPPQAWSTFRQQIARSAGVLFVSPEYNRSVPGGLKNALDIGSRPSGKSVWNGKPGAVITVSPGTLGGFGANHHLRQIMVSLNIPTMPQPEAYISGAGKLFDAEGHLNNDSSRDFLTKFMNAFSLWVSRFQP